MSGHLPGTKKFSDVQANLGLRVYNKIVKAYFVKTPFFSIVSLDQKRKTFGTELGKAQNCHWIPGRAQLSLSNGNDKELELFSVCNYVRIVSDHNYLNS